MPQIPKGKMAAKGWTLPQLGHVPVKNTFIEDLPEDLPEEDPVILRATSAPTLVGTPCHPAAAHFVELLSLTGSQANDKKGLNLESEYHTSKSDSEVSCA